MATFGDPSAPSRMLRHLHRAMITDNTDSRPRIWRGVPRKWGWEKQLRAPHPHRTPPLLRRGNSIPRPRARVFLVVSATCSSLALRVRRQRNVWAHQSNFPAAFAAPRPALPAVSVSLLETMTRRSSARPYGLGLSGGGGGERMRRIQN